MSARHKPVMVWQRGGYRVVAVDDVDEERSPVRFLVLEARCRDALGGEAWSVVCAHEATVNEALDALMVEVVSRVDVLPAWVREIVKADGGSSGSGGRRVTSVVNVRDLPLGWECDPRYVYIGRSGHGFRGEYGNRHRSDCKRSHSRAGALSLFEDEARLRYAGDANYRAKVEQLRGKLLVCFCDPLPCHGRVYVQLLGEEPTT